MCGIQCGVSSSNAKRVCEPCPGGSRLECSDPTHNCFAGVTGCPNTPASSSYQTPPSTTGSPHTPPTPPSPVTPNTTNRPTTIMPSKHPTNFPTKFPMLQPSYGSTGEPTRNPITTFPDNNSYNKDDINDNNNGNADITDDLYLHGALRSSYFCGYSWDLTLKTCNMAYPCPRYVSFAWSLYRHCNCVG